MEIQHVLSQAFAQGAPLSSKEIDQLLPLVNKEIERQDARFRQINSTGKGQTGPLYSDLLLKGTADEVAEMKAECERLVIERQQLQAKRAKLYELKRGALISEAAADLPNLQQALIDKIESAERAKAAMDEAFQQIDLAYSAVTRARGQCNAGGLTPTASATMKTVRRLEALARYATAGRGDGAWSSLRGGHAGNIGLDGEDGERGVAHGGAQADWLRP